MHRMNGNPHQGNTEPASLGSESHHKHPLLSLTMAIVMTALGLVAFTNTAASAHTSSASSANSSKSTQSTAKVQSTALADRLAAPQELLVTAIDSTGNEDTRQLRTNSVAKKKHQVRQVRNKVIKIARAQIGDSYRAGHSGPNAFDCSGLVRYVFKKATGRNLPHYSKAQYQQVRKVSKKNAQPGDLVFFFRNGAHHVGIYIGNGKMIDAPSAGKKVRVSPISGSWWGRSYTGIGRLLPA
jgi:cell wall-associated NlpC family hydrolase